MKKLVRKTVKLVDLKPNPKNPREIDDANLKALENAIRRFGLVQELVVNTKTGYIVGGHQRLKAMLGVVS
jgi:ParB-like chromosome segregation protein Spo0J